MLVYVLKTLVLGNFLLGFDILRKPGAFLRVARVSSAEGVSPVPAPCRVRSGSGWERLVSAVWPADARRFLQESLAS